MLPPYSTYSHIRAEEDPVADHALFVEGLQQLLGGDVPPLLTGQLQHDLTVVHHDGPVAQLEGGGDVVGDHQAGDAVVRHDIPGQFQHLFRGGRVQGSGVFIQKQQLGGDQSRHQQCQRLALAAGQQAYGMIHPVLQTQAQHAQPLPEVGPVLFGDHDPGYIHRAVQAHIVFKNSIIDKELVLPGIGRADIYNPETYEMWEIKHGGSTDEMMNARITNADSQVAKYVQLAKERINLPYRKGHAGAFNGEFILTCDSISYLITYDTPAAGVILYYVKQVKKQESSAFAVYPSKEYIASSKS